MRPRATSDKPSFTPDATTRMSAASNQFEATGDGVSVDRRDEWPAEIELAQGGLHEALQALIVRQRDHRPLPKRHAFFPRSLRVGPSLRSESLG